MLIAQISDTHLLSLQENEPAARWRADGLRHCVRAVNALARQPAAVIHTGDMVNFDSNNTYDLARDILGELRAPFFPTVGNRDSRRDLISAFLAPKRLAANAPFCQYRVRLDGFDLISVDTKSDTRRIGASCDARLAELEKLLKEDEQTPVFLFLHHPPAPVPVLKNPLQFESEQQARGFSDLFDRFDNIQWIFCGHTHRSDNIAIGRHRASTLPSIATDIRIDSYGQHLDDAPLFQLHELCEDGHMISTTMLASNPFTPDIIHSTTHNSHAAE